MIFAIHAYETNYGGYHGIEDWAFDEAISENDDSLNDYARQLSIQVIECYGFLEEEYLDGEEVFDEDDLDDILNEHIAYDIIPLPKAASVEEMEALLKETNDPESICEEYK